MNYVVIKIVKAIRECSDQFLSQKLLQSYIRERNSHASNNHVSKNSKRFEVLPKIINKLST